MLASRMRPVKYAALIGLALVCCAPIAAESCTPSLPPEALNLLASSYPGYRVLQLGDLNSDDQTIWKNSYGDACPGVVEGFFTGPSKAYAVLLVPDKQNQGEIKAVLVEAAPDGGMTHRRIFSEPSQPNLPVIRKSKPGVYEDAETHAKVRTSNDVVLIEHLESSITALSVSRGKVKRLTLAE